MKKITKLNKILLTAFLLSACDPSKPHLEGERISFLSNTANPTFVKKDVVFDKLHVYTQWPQSGGNAQHFTYPTILNKEIKKKWETSIGEGLTSGRKCMSNVITSDQLIYTMDTVGKVSALNFDGNVVFEIETSPKDQSENTLGGGLALDGNTLIVSTSFAEVLAFDAKTGKSLWKEHLSAPSRTAPTIHNGFVLVPTINNEVHVFNIKSGKKEWSHQGLQEISALLGGASPAAHDDTVVACYSSGEYYALDMKTGTPIWMDTLTSALRKDTVSSIAHIKSNPVIANDKVYVISHGGHIVANNIKTGARMWQKDYSSPHDMVVGGDFLFLLTIENELVALERNTGDVKWKASLAEFVKKQEKDIVTDFSAPVLVNGQAIVASSSGELLFINAKSGELSSKMNIGTSTVQQPLVINKHLIILSDNGGLTVYK